MPWTDRIADWMEHTEDQLTRQVIFLTAWLALLCAIELIDLAGPWTLDQWGIRPRSAGGLPGILFAPFLHGGVAHLATNSVPLVALAWLTLLSGWKRFWTVTVLVICGAGSAVWLTGRADSIHIGSSSLIFGYFGYLLVFGILRRSWPWIGVAAGIGLLYGSLLTGLVTESGPRVSSEGHVSGLAFGILAAFLLNRRKPSAA